MIPKTGDVIPTTSVDEFSATIANGSVSRTRVCDGVSKTSAGSTIRISVSWLIPKGSLRAKSIGNKRVGVALVASRKSLRFSYASDSKVSSAFCSLLSTVVLLHAADYPAPVEGDSAIAIFKFASGETLPELRHSLSDIGKAEKDAQGKRVMPFSLCNVHDGQRRAVHPS